MAEIVKLKQKQFVLSGQGEFAGIWGVLRDAEGNAYKIVRAASKDVEEIPAKLVRWILRGREWHVPRLNGHVPAEMINPLGRAYKIVRAPSLDRTGEFERAERNAAKPRATPNVAALAKRAAKSRKGFCTNVGSRGVKCILPTGHVGNHRFVVGG